MIKEKLKTLETRDKVYKNIKYKEDETKNHLSKSKIKPEIDYEYYICDYCGEEIILKNKKDERDGGTVKMPTSLTKTMSVIELALHDRCLNKVLNELEPDRVKVNN